MSLLLDTSTGHVCRLHDYEWDAGLFCHRLSLVTMNGAAIKRTSHQVEVLPNNILEFPRRMPASMAVPPTASLRMPPSVPLNPAEGGALSNYGDV